MDVRLDVCGTGAAGEECLADEVGERALAGGGRAGYAEDEEEGWGGLRGLDMGIHVRMGCHDSSFLFFALVFF